MSKYVLVMPARDGDADRSRSLADALRGNGITIVQVMTPSEAVWALERRGDAVVAIVVDLRDRERAPNRLELLEYLRTSYPALVRLALVFDDEAPLDEECIRVNTSDAVALPSVLRLSLARSGDSVR